MRTLLRAVTIVAILAAGAVQAAPDNPLRDNPSPYLAMHATDPVHWQPWSRDVMARARREGKLVFLSIGYFACRWCHVMQHESFQNPEIAPLLNRDFIPVVVDRELNPALDARMIAFVERTRGQAGWPLNVFVTPAGYPLIGTVYLPPGRFKTFLVKLNQAWRSDRGGLEALAREAARSLPQPEISPGPHLPPGWADELRRALVARALQLGDDMAGGFGQANKFPMAPQLDALLDALSANANPALARLLRLTLDRMASQGLRDHLRGGFFRYATDPNWQVPHFEKMLYSNALLASVYMKAARVLDEPRYLGVARDTVDFMLRELTTGSGAMISSLSAVDGNGVDGGFYLWGENQLSRLLSPKELAVVRLCWGMHGSPTTPDGYLPAVAASSEAAGKALGLAPAQVRRLLRAARGKLLAAQRRRVLPRDTKQLAGWNGLALRTLAQAAALPDSGRYRAAGRRVRDYLIRRLWTGERLLRARGARGRLGEASLQDYAYVASGLYAWARVSRDERALNVARKIVARAWHDYHRPRGWVLEAAPVLSHGVAQPVIADGPMPSPSATLIEVSLRLARDDRDTRLLRRARSALNVGHATLGSDAFWFATQIQALVLAQPSAAGADGQSRAR
jgi:uncharacterized protein YyaL (SSP411 family)